MTPSLRAQREPVPVVEWLQAVLLAINLVWTMLCLGGYRPETMLVTLALTGSMLVFHFVACAMENRPLASADWPGWCLLAFLAYALINVVFVTPVRWLGWLDWLGWANMFAIFWVMRNGIRAGRPRRVLFMTLIALGIVAVLLACHQRFVQPDWLMMGRRQVDQFLGRASGPFGIPNSLAGFLILLLPATGSLAFRRGAAATERVWWTWVTLVLGFGLLLTVSRGGWIALGIALVVWPLSARRWRWQRRAVAAAAVVALVLGAGIILYRTAPKVRERFDFLVRHSGELSRPILWRAAWEIFRANPLVGGGAGSFNVRFEQHRPAGFRDEPQWVHNDALNTLSDYGALGLVLLLGTIVVIATRQRSMDPVPASDPLPWLESGATRHALGIGLVAFGLQTLVDFHLKIPALAMTGALLAALAMGAPESGTTATASSLGRWNRIRWLLAAFVVVTALFPILRFYRAEALRYRARQTIDVLLTRQPADVSARLQAVELTLQRATSLAPRHAGAWAELAHVVALRAWAAPALGAALAAPAVAAARRATELAPIVPEFWMRLGVALDLAARPDEARGAFEKATRLAPHSSNAWYYYAYHLSHDTEQRAPALRAIATCLSLDPGNAAAEALRVKLTERRSGAPFNP